MLKFHFLISMSQTNLELAIKGFSFTTKTTARIGNITFLLGGD